MKTIYLAQPKHSSWNHFFKPALGGLCLASALALLGPLPADAAAAKSISVEQTIPVKTEWSENWQPEVRDTLQELCSQYGKNAANYKENRHPYAVLDFEDTTSIGNVQEQLMIWQLDHLAFAISPETMKSVLQTGISKKGLEMTYGAADGKGRSVRIGDAIEDAARAYAVLYNQGLIHTRGSVLAPEVKEQPEYQEFVGKMRWLYDAVSQNMDASVSCPWVTYWFTGMHPLDVYTIAYDCDSFYGDPKKGQSWDTGTYTTPMTGAAGQVSVSYKNGITVTPEMRELYANFHKNGIDAWILSSSSTDVVRAAVDYFKIKGVSGTAAMMNQLDKNQRYTNAYDDDLHPQTQGAGKTATINKIFRKHYKGAGPIFCAIDAQEDFNFATEYRDTKAVLVMNRCHEDDAALCAGIASYQQARHITLAKANAAGDAKFLLQGRNENTGTLWPDTATLQLGQEEPQRLSDKAEKAVQQLEKGMSIKEVLQRDAHLKEYKGYKSM